MRVSCRLPGVSLLTKAKTPRRSSSPSPSSSSRGLVERLLDNPQLPAYIAGLETPALNKLIRHLGKEDSRELMAYATPEQVRELVEMDAWQNERPGTEETFDPDKFLEWLALWEDMSADFLTEKLRELGNELLSLTLMKHVTVADVHEVGIGAAPHEVEFALVDTFANYAVMPTDEDAWPVINNLLIQVWDCDADFMTEVLAACCVRRSILNDKTNVSSEDNTLHHDTAADRQQRREAAGYVTPLNASIFLGDARATSIDMLCIEVAYDATTASHLRRARQRRDASPPVASRDANDPAQSRTREPEPDRTQDWQALDTLLKNERILEPNRPDRLLAGPAGDNTLYVKRALGTLEDKHPSALQDRLDEVVYLANVLVSGSSVQGGVFTEEAAAKCVYSTCNLGLTYCLLEDPWDDEATMLTDFLEREPGLVKAFRIGYHLLSQIPHKAIVALARELTSTPVQRRLRRHPWIQEQIARGFGSADLQSKLDDEKLESVSSLIETLGMIFDSSTCQQLRILCDPLPCFPRSLESAGPRIHVDTRKRYVNVPADVRAILVYLDELRL